MTTSAVLGADRVSELISLLPTVLWIAFAGSVLYALRRPIREELLPRLSGIRAFGFELSLAQQSLEQAAKKQDVELSPEASSALVRRAQLVRPLLQGRRVLFVDDHPENNVYEARSLETFGVSVALARTSAEARGVLGRARCDVIVSDMNRAGDPGEGQRFLEQLRQDRTLTPVIFYVGKLDPAKGTPPKAFAITNRPDELLHFVLDVLERGWGSR